MNPAIPVTLISMSLGFHVTHLKIMTIVAPNKVAQVQSTNPLQTLTYLECSSKQLALK